MQPSNQLKGLVEAYSHVGSEETAELKILEKTIVNTIGVYMVSEGYTEKDVVEFLSTSSEGKLCERFEEALESGVASSYITEEGKFDTKLRYVEGAVYERLDEGVRSAIGTAIKRTWKNPKFHKMARQAAKYGVGTGVGSAIDDYLTGGKVKRWAGYGVEKAREGMHKFPEPPSKNNKKKTNEIPTYEGFEYVEEIDEQTVLAKKDGDWVSLDKKTGKTQQVNPTAAAIARYKDYEQRAKDQKMMQQSMGSSANVEKEIERERREAADQAGRRRSGESTGEFHKRLRADLNKDFPTTRRDSSGGGGASDGGRRTGDTAPATPSGSTVSDVRPQTPKRPPADHTGGMKKWAQLYGPGGAKQLKSPTKAQKAIFKKYGMGEEVEVDESLQNTLDNLTKKGQRGLERLGIKINRTSRGTARPAAGSKPGQEGGGKYTREMNEVELVTSFLVSEGFSDTVEGALAMLEGMSESWFNDILDVRLMEEAMLEYLQVMGEAESRDEALYIVSEMDEEAIDLLAIEVEDIMESMASANRMKELEKERLSNRAPSVKYPAKSAPYGGARSREFQQKPPEPSGSRGPEFEHGSGQGPDKGSLGSRYNHMIKNPKNLSKNTGKYPRDKKGNLMY